MGDLFGSTKDGNTKKEEVSSAADDEVRQTSPAQVSIDIPGGSERARWRVLHRVPPQVRENKKHIYDPVVLSLGPYHHGQPQFRRAEKLKDEVLNIICGGKDKGFLCSKILERVDEIRHFYGELSRDEYADKALAEMMLRDGCFVLHCMRMETDIHGYRLGMSGIAFLTRDFYMLENQIPLWFIKLLISLILDDNKDEGEALLYNYLSDCAFGDFRLTRVPWNDEEEEPLHLLEAARRTILHVEEEKGSNIEPIKNHCHWNIKSAWGRKKSSTTSTFEMINCPFRSVTDLKAKGIRFGPGSQCLKDIRFTSYWFYGELHLPTWFVTHNSNVFFSNLIALEMSPEIDTELVVTSYVNFMKSLIKSPRDIKELREKGILFSRFPNDEEVVKMFKEIDTYGFYNSGIFQGVKISIEKHCNNKAKTWMAELAYTYFRTPWTAIALVAATFLLCLTFLQTYYTMIPINRGK